MQVDDPPYLSVGTAVSAKYKGAFCEAKVSKVVRIVKCKVTYKMGLGTATLSDDQIKGTLRVGQIVQAKHPDKKELVEATIAKIQDCSQYTVVFDDGDITTLRRTALCLKSGRHFNESETLDQLPLTHPEHFGNPVMGGRRGRRSRQPKEDSSEGEAEEENEPDLEAYLSDIGRVVSVEASDKKRNKDNWFPGLVVIPSAQPTVRINCKDEYLIRSFKDGRYYTVPKKEVTEFTREMGDKVENPSLSEAIQKAVRFLDNNELPPHWEKSTLFQSQPMDSESDENFSDSSDDEPCEKKDLFVAQLYKFMDEAGTPLNKTPTVASRDIDLHRLFQVVQKLGGYNRVNNQNKWRNVTGRLHLPNNQSTFNQVRSVYKKCLYSYEGFYRTLGVTMLNHTRSNKKNRGRSLIRDKDRNTPIPISSPAAPDKEEEPLEEKKEEPKPKKPDKKKPNQEISDTGSESAGVDPQETKDIGKAKREKVETKVVREKKVKVATGEKVKALVEKFEEQTKKEEEQEEEEEEEKVQFTRSKSLSKSKEVVVVTDKKQLESKQSKDSKIPPKAPKKPPPNVLTDDEKKKGKKRVLETKPGDSKNDPAHTVSIGDKLKVYYGPTHESKVTYEAKVIDIDKDQSGPVYLVHYTGWNTRYDEWIQPQRIAENLSATTKAKRMKQTTSQASSSTKGAKPVTMSKRKRGGSVTSRSSISAEVPRSTTPSSVTSSSSRTKSPAVPATRSASRLKKLDASKRSRRTSAHTDISLPTEDSESEESTCEFDLTKTRSGAKLEEPELKTYKRKSVKSLPLSKVDKKKDKEDDDTEKEEEPEKSLKRSRRLKRSPEKSTEESEDEGNPPKGRDFDLNQIRSELKGFSKAIKVSSIDPLEKDISSSDDSTSPPILEKPLSLDDEEEEEPEEEKEEILPEEKSPPSSEDIYEFKEPEPFEFESRTKLNDDKNAKKRLVPRLFEDLEKSPRKKSSKMSPKQESPFRRTPLRRQDSSDEDEPIRSETPVQKEVDPFDKLVESPSFNLIKTIDRSSDKTNVIRNISDDSLSLFRELPETEDDYSKDMELSDCESQTQIFSRESELFSDTFLKPSPEQNTMDMEFSSGKIDGGKLKDSDDDLREQIQRAIAQSSSTDDESNDALLVTPSTSNYQLPKKELEVMPSISSILGMNTPPCSQITEVSDKMEIEKLPKVELTKEEEKTVKQTISPALQETDSSLLESFVSQPPFDLDVKLEETAKELSNVKTGTKIADSILQKFNTIKKNELEEKMPKPAKVEPKVEEEKPEFKFEMPKEEVKHVTAESELPDNNAKLTAGVQKEETMKSEEQPIKKSFPVQKADASEMKKRSKKVLSRAYIEESDSDSSDSEQLVIARSDDDSQTNSYDTKLQPDLKESDSSNMFTHLQTTDDSQSQDERIFNFDQNQEEKLPEISQVPPKEQEIEITTVEPAKEEEPDPQLHSLLLCEEEIPRSPAPPTETIPSPEIKPAKSEMPFASAPGTSSNSKSMLLEQSPQQKKSVVPQPLVEVPMIENRVVEGSTVIDNTPPTTPESTLSLSPRQCEIGDLSPNAGDESCKSNEVEALEFSRQRGNSSIKVSPYSEEDTMMTSEPSSINKKTGQENSSPPLKKRRKSLRSNEEAAMPIKRTRKSMNRSRQNSDSDDTSEHSNGASNNNVKTASFNKADRLPRPSKYNFFVEFDPSLDSSQRIAVLQQKLTELRKTYADVKAELAAVERRRKKIRRREREALKAAKQEMACA